MFTIQFPYSLHSKPISDYITHKAVFVSIMDMTEVLQTYEITLHEVDSEFRVLKFGIHSCWPIFAK